MLYYVSVFMYTMIEKIKLRQISWNFITFSSSLQRKNTFNTFISIILCRQIRYKIKLQTDKYTLSSI